MSYDSLAEVSSQFRSASPGAEFQFVTLVAVEILVQCEETVQVVVNLLFVK